MMAGRGDDGLLRPVGVQPEQEPQQVALRQPALAPAHDAADHWRRMRDTAADDDMRRSVKAGCRCQLVVNDDRNFDVVVTDVGPKIYDPNAAMVLNTHYNNRAPAAAPQPPIAAPQPPAAAPPPSPLPLPVTEINEGV